MSKTMMLMVEYGVASGLIIGKGNIITMRKPASVPLYPPQIQHDLTWEADI
jgi:hypothetical protein